MNKDIDTLTLNKDISMDMTKEQYKAYIEAKLLGTNFFKNSSLDITQVLTHLTTNPAGRKDDEGVEIARLSEKQQQCFIELVTKVHEDRTFKDLLKAGVISFDWCSSNNFTDEEINKYNDMYGGEFDHLSYFTSDKFLENWLSYGYFQDMNYNSWHLISLRYANFGKSNIANKDFSDCDMRYANMDKVIFYKCSFDDTNLKNASMSGGSLEDCVGLRDDDRAMIKEFIECGVIGLTLDDSSSSDSEYE